jgi:mono/diheme cytochrome c family protein
MSNNQQENESYARENAEPVERNNPVPWLLGLVAACLCVWGVSYFLLDQSLEPAAALPSKSAATTAQGPAAAAMPQAPAPAAVAADGAQIFASRCASCHQATGAGLPGVFPPLAGSEWVNGDASKVAEILLLGINGPITVKGATFHGVMPAFGHQLSDAEIAAVASHVRASFGNKSPAVTADVVKAERAKLGNRSAPLAGGAELQAQH